jgi:molybdopterin-guanine dinucleotide biosynthesis protein B
MARMPPMVSFIAPSGTGKTTLIEAVVRILSERGLRVAVVKHDAHRLKLDTPGKDSYRFRQAGAWRTLVASDHELGLFGKLEGSSSLGGLVTEFLTQADLVLLEGFRSTTLSAIRVQRSGVRDVEWSPGRVRVVAIASDTPTDSDLPHLSLDSPEEVADFLLSHIVEGAQRRQITGLVAAHDGVKEAIIERSIRALAAAGIDHTMVIRPPGTPSVAGTQTVHDIRPGHGLLGALLTGLAAAGTPDVLLIGSHRAPPSPEFLRGMVEWAPRSADVVVPVSAGRAMPIPGLYGHRCLSAIQASLLAGELRVDGWWDHIRVFSVPESIWRPTWPEGEL